jgi:hypothetical protein
LLQIYSRAATLYKMLFGGALLTVGLAVAGINAAKTPRQPKILPAVAPPGGFTAFNWDKVSTFCFPGSTWNVDGREQQFSKAQIKEYVKFDLVMISMLNVTALHAPPWDTDGFHVPQATAMSIKQAAAIKSVSPDKPVFAYITGYLAQNTFEGGAKYRGEQYSEWWLRDTNGIYVDDNWTITHPTNCHCAGYCQGAPGPMWDFRQARVRAYFMEEMVTPMISAEHINGIFFDDAFDIPNYCFTPPSGRAPCIGNYTFTRAEQEASGAATLEHFDAVLASMAAQNKGTVMSMNPVTASSFPINSSQSDAMLLKHRAFRFWEFFGDDDIELALELGAKGHPFLAHFGASANWTVREYSFATYLIVASEWSYYGMSAGWGTASFPWYPEFDRPLGAPKGPAMSTGSPPSSYSREFEHVSVTLDTKKKSASVVWKDNI